MNPQDLLKHYGSQRAVAQAFGVTDAAVLKWLRSGVLPPLRVYQAKELLSRFKRPKGKR
jgi:hypothetical protein